MIGYYKYRDVAVDAVNNELELGRVATLKINIVLYLK